MQVTSKAAEIIAASKSNPRVKPGRESFSAEKMIGKHVRYGVQVKAPTSSTPMAMEPSELEYAKLGVYFKYFLRRHGLEMHFREVEKSLLDDILNRDVWVSFENGEKTFHTGHPAAGEKASLLNDTLSGGEYLVPEWYDDLLIHTPLLHGELLPHVTIRTVPHGDTYRSAVIGNPTITSNLTDGTSATAMDATDLVGDFRGSIFDAGVYLKVSRDLLADVPVVDLGQDLLREMGQAWLNWLEEQIAVGDGTTEPQGIFNATGATVVSSANGTSGPFDVSDIEDLIFGLPLARRRMGFPAFVMSDTMYKRARALPVGTSDARRIFGMDHQRYTLFEYPVKIQDNIPAGSLAFVNLTAYRLYRRPGPILAVETGGQTLTLDNLALIYLRGRVGGEIETGAAISKMTDGPVVDS